MPPRGKKGKNAPKKEAVAELTSNLKEITISPRTTTGVLASRPQARDVKVIQFNLQLHGMNLVVDSELELNYGRRYGLIALNGTGKSTLLAAIGSREVPIPEHITIFHLEREIEKSEKTALECVLDELEQEKQKLEKEAEELAVSESEIEQERLMDLYEILDGMDYEVAKSRAALILHGLGFTHEMQNKKANDFSGGWTMRIALARALFYQPAMLLLDEPTNHLDLEACVWLEEYLKNYKRILVLISHSQDFLNGVCTNIIHFHQKKLTYYGGNYDTYIKARAEKEQHQMKKYQWEQDQIAHMKEYIARFGHGSAKLARQAKSKEKTMARMEEGGLTERVVKDSIASLTFFDCDYIPPPVLQFTNATFGYSKDKILYRDLDLGIDLDSRVALVGPNGAGKSTLLKLMMGQLAPLNGMVRKHNHLKIGWYHQHLTETLDLDLTPLEYMMKQFPGEVELDRMRQIVGKFGITGKVQTTPLKILSDGQKSRVVFAEIAHTHPHLLLLDEPTNHLDIETIDALADAINSWNGGLVLVSHDFRLINQVAEQIWLCENKSVTPWKGTIEEYKSYLRGKMEFVAEAK